MAMTVPVMMMTMMRMLTPSAIPSVEFMLAGVNATERCSNTVNEY